jgi:selenocysteine lyase/cysteine desulfurase
MRAHDDPGHLDFVALSAHKMYAPFGTGALVGSRDWFGGDPDHAGGGTIRAVTPAVRHPPRTPTRQRLDGVGLTTPAPREVSG